MKKISLFVAALCMSISMLAQSEDPVIMTVNGVQVKRSEFEYSYNKNNSDGVLDKKTVEDYVPLFVNFKLKVAEAVSQGIDTISSVRKELDGYKEQFVIPTIVDSAYIEREARRTYENTAARFAGQDLLVASHILVLLRQDATAEQIAAGRNRIDSIYNILKDVPADQLPARFADVAKACSDDKGSSQRGGALGQFGKGMMIPDFEAAAYQLQPGQMSKPFKSTVGYHIIYMTDRHPFEPYEFHRESILKFLDQRGVKEASANAYIDSLAQDKGMERKEIIEVLLRDIMEGDADQRYLAMEYQDGTLMYEVSKKDVWDKAQQDEAGQEAFFNANKKKYVWDEPRFIGIILHAKDAETVAKAKKLIKGIAEEDYAKTLVDAFNTDSVKLVRVTKGLFKPGDNKYADNIVFKKKGEVEPMNGFPVCAAFGKKLKKPRTYKDVKGQVVNDYQDALEQEWVEMLRKKYDVQVNEEVVKTVNRH